MITYFTTVYTCNVNYLHACLFFFTYVYTCHPMFIIVYSCLPMFNRVYLCLTHFTRACFVVLMDLLPHLLHQIQVPWGPTHWCWCDIEEDCWKICLYGDLEDACGTSQRCGGICSGIEGAIHTLHDLFNEHQEEGWGHPSQTLPMPSIVSIAMQHFGTLGSFGPAVPSSCLTPIEVGLLSP